MFQLAVRFVDRPEQLFETRGLVDRPKTLELGTEKFHISWRQEANCYYPFIGHNAAPKSLK